MSVRFTYGAVASWIVTMSMAGLAFVQQLPYVDKDRIFAAGCSFGGIESLLGAESRAGYKAAISISPGALSWDRSDALRARLTQAVDRLEIPVLLIQPAHDASLGPGHTLGAEAARRGKPLTVSCRRTWRCEGTAVACTLPRALQQGRRPEPSSGRLPCEAFGC